MSNKYRLIKIYPGSPKLNTIINFGDIDCDFTHNPEKYPEFWQKVVEKDYEILSYSDNNNNIFREKDNQGILHRLDFKIHSVKRLSDSEIFTIGDKINCHCLSKKEINNTFIVSFNINNNLRIYDNFAEYHSLKDIKKAKQPLFTTEDGVDIFAGMSFYYVCEELELYNTICCTDEKPYKNAKQFSTKEKAEEYILLNKPLLTLKDIEELLCKNTSSYFLEKFKKRAQKLNNKN